MQVIKGCALIFKGLQQTEEKEVDAYVEELQNVGLSAHSIQVLGFDFVQSVELLDRLSLDRDDVSGIVFSSQRAVEAVHRCTVAFSDECLARFNTVFSCRHVFAVGEATAKKIDLLLGLRATGHNSGNAESLAEFIKNVVPPNSKPLVFPCGNLRSDRLPTILYDAGIRVECVKVYETKPHDNLELNIQTFIESNGFPEILVYFSPSGVTFTVPILKKLHFPLAVITFVAIGQSTKYALEKVELAPSCTAKQPNPKSLAAAILDCKPAILNRVA